MPSVASDEAGVRLDVATASSDGGDDETNHFHGGDENGSDGVDDETNLAGGVLTSSSQKQEVASVGKGSARATQKMELL